MVEAPPGSIPPYIIAQVYNEHNPSIILEYFLLLPGEMFSQRPYRIDFIPYNYPNLTHNADRMLTTTETPAERTATTPILTAPRSRLANFFGALLQAADLLGNSNM